MLITQELFTKMNFDTPPTDLNAARSATITNDEDDKPSVLIVFKNSDVNAALYYLNKSLSSPSDPHAIATVLVQEAIKDDFIEKLELQFNSQPLNKMESSKQFKASLETAEKLNAHIITVDKKDKNIYKPTIVCDFSHEQLGALSPSGVVTFHTFRTAKEAISLVNKETLDFNNVSIWHGNHGCAYELVAALKSKNFFINCPEVPLTVLEESIKERKNNVHLDKSYHYETLQHDGVQKSIVFPVGTIFAN